MKTNIVRFLVVVILLASSAMVSGCGTNVVNIPAGFVGKMLTPTGWQGEWLEAGQVDLGVHNLDGTYNTLVLMEVTSKTVLEQFLQSGALLGDVTDTEDHRVVTQDGVPVSVDVYVRAMVPADKQTRTAILAQVTPRYIEGDPDDVKRILVEDIYNQFARPEVRGKIRSLFASYVNYSAIYADFSKIPEKLGTEFSTIFEKNGVPLKLMSVSLSNVKPDEAIWAVMNKVAAAEAEAQAINTIGEAIRNNPEYQSYQQWMTLKDMAEKDPNLLIVVDGSNSQSSSEALTLAILQQMMKTTIPPVTYTPTPTPSP